jgi:GNAT superfamily N-acetyltransferase
MTQSYIVTLTDSPDPADKQAVNDGLNAFNIQLAGEDNYRPLAIFLRDDQNNLIGGLLGETFWNWLHISILWLREDARGQGYGQQMVAMAEQEAVKRGCTDSFVDTLSFQAPDFYRKLGYVEFGRQDGLPPGYARYYLYNKGR